METNSTTTNTGAFVSSLKRNNQKIRDDRANSIAEDTQLIAFGVSALQAVVLTPWIRPNGAGRTGWVKS